MAPLNSTPKLYVHMYMFLPITQHRQLCAVCSTTSAISYSAVPLHRHHLVHHRSSLGKLNMDIFPFILLHLQYLPLNPSTGAEWTGYRGQSLSTTNYCIFLLFFLFPQAPALHLPPILHPFLLHPFLMSWLMQSPEYTLIEEVAGLRGQSEKYPHSAHILPPPFPFQITE